MTMERDREHAEILGYLVELLDRAARAHSTEHVVHTIAAELPAVPVIPGNEYSDDEPDPELVEGMIGAAFIVCQAQITAIVSAVKRIARHEPLSIPTTKPDILARGERIPGKTYTKVAAIDHYANFFKHADEWDLENLRPNQRRTADAIAELSGAPYGRGSVTKGLSIIVGDAPEPEQLREIQAVVERWGAQLLADIHAFFVAQSQS